MLQQKWVKIMVAWSLNHAMEDLFWDLAEQVLKLVLVLIWRIEMYQMAAPLTSLLVVWRSAFSCRWWFSSAKSQRFAVHFLLSAKRQVCYGMITDSNILFCDKRCASSFLD
jgi:hypothetical protein